MNVTNNGYYTSQYLDQHRIRPHESRSPLRPPVSSDRGTPRSTTPSHSGISPTSELTAKSRPKKTDPKSPIAATNEEKEMLSVHPSPASATTKDLSPYSRLTAAGSTDDLELDPDYLEQEITPAQLNIIQVKKKQEQLQRRLERRERREKEARKKYADKDHILSGKEIRQDAEDGSEGPEIRQDSRRHDYSSYFNHHDNALQESDFLSFYTRDEDDSLLGGSYSRRRKAPKPPKKDYDGYYIDQKQQYDQADYKPKLYTHKTFNEVFANKDESTDKYNPIDFVFEDPVKLKEQEQNQKLRSAFKNIQVRMGKNNYQDYDYYAQKKKQQAERIAAKTRQAQARQEKELREKMEKEKLQKEQQGGQQMADEVVLDSPDVFVNNVSDSDDDDDLEMFANEEDRQTINKNKNLKKIWKRKLRLARKELGKDFFNNAQKEALARAARKEAKAKGKKKPKSPKIQELRNLPAGGNLADELELSSEEEEEKDLVAKSRSPARPSYGPSENFSPAWNYLLSWLVYEPVGTQPASPRTPVEEESYDEDTTEEEMEAEAEELALVPSARLPSQKSVKPKKKKKKTKFSLQGLKKSKHVFSNWGQPASAMFNGRIYDQLYQKQEVRAALVPSERSFSRSNQSLAPPYFVDDGSQEFIIEVDEDDESFVDQLYYNPVLKLLERQPPTSYSSLEPEAHGLSLAQSVISRSTGRSVETALSPQRSLFNTEGGPLLIISNINALIKSIKIMKVLFAPIDVISEHFPHLQTVVILVELVIFMWVLYELLLLVDALCMAVKAVCAPMIAVGRFMNRVM